ncbi:molecular chaperone Hsp33 [Breoghania corrubedonensis]|uniref:Molecular chaperone Hsp33 n=1 Tax=Breoghania corrubedonensis TaxID=665038 RepID=A0A2T5VEI3_9HYPH|nr:Hsp33 family molecular chaperone [Breoghania corrubedonensis]PTW62143.1 molecular chaperone Hsp33 [Breoghania corrubedonensis]
MTSERQAATDAGPIDLAGDDAVLPFAVEPLDVRGRVVYLGDTVDAILQRHAYPPAVSRLLGEAIVLTALLGTSLKFDGRFILQTQTDGPVSMLVVDFETPDAIRACAKFKDEAVAEAVAAGRTSSAELLGSGTLAMTIDQGRHMNRYQGVVALDGGSLEDVAHQYFAQSEQIPTRVRLAVAEVLERQPGETPSHAWRAGGLIVQFLPESPERMRKPDLHPGDAPEDVDLPDAGGEVDDAWVEAQVLVDTIKDVELTDPAMAAERLLIRLFHERGVRVFDPRPLHDRCRCSHERVGEMLRGFSADDIDHMTVDGQIEVTCEFCNSTYHFDPAEFDGGETS